jgi:hypothetical protein
LVNQGLIDPADVDLNLRSIITGYSADSPCIGSAEDEEDMGCYDVTYEYLPSSYTDIWVPKPVTLDADLVSFNQIINEMQDGSISKTKEGNRIEVKLKYNGLKNEYANLLADMFDADGDIYCYFEPETNPTTYRIMQMKTDKLSMSPKFWKQSGIGVQEIEIVLVGKYN